jgi:hypothetical protein
LFDPNELGLLMIALLAMPQASFSFLPTDTLITTTTTTIITTITSLLSYSILEEALLEPAYWYWR